MTHAGEWGQPEELVCILLLRPGAQCRSLTLLLLLLNLVLVEEHSSLDNGIILDESNLVGCPHNVLPRSVEKASTCRAQQLDWYRLALASGHR